MIYLDHAATSWPKPAVVAQAMVDYMERAGGNPGRSGHRLSLDAGRVVYEAREALAELFHVANPLRIVMAMNATHAINLALSGMLKPGDRVVTSSMEHNAVMRPLRALEARGVEVCVVPCGADGRLDPADVARALAQRATRLVALTHGSNVSGALMPVGEVAALAHRAGALFLLDAAQTAGVVPLDMTALGVDLLAFTGHKGLQGPPGTGGLVFDEHFDVAQCEPLMRGGTGSLSEHEQQPSMLPDKYESGTQNGVGIAGLGAAVRYILERGIHAVHAHETELSQLLYEGLLAIPGVTVYAPPEASQRTATLSFTLRGWRVSEVGLALDEEYDILCRVGLHCAPAAHRTLGTFPEGTVRLSAGLSTTCADIEAAIRAVERIAAS
jgi:cysteine desulfurase/selenocysteine lyase